MTRRDPLLQDFLASLAAVSVRPKVGPEPPLPSGRIAPCDRRASRVEHVNDCRSAAILTRSAATFQYRFVVARLAKAAFWRSAIAGLGAAERR